MDTMISTISKEFAFSASHRLDGLAPDHPCSRMHGHNYVVVVELTGHIGPVGFVLDYGELAPFKTWLDATVDHRHLNDQVDFNPTAELLARWFSQRFQALVLVPSRVSEIRIGVSETPKTWAWISADLTFRGVR